MVSNYYNWIYDRIYIIKCLFYVIDIVIIFYFSIPNCKSFQES